MPHYGGFSIDWLHKQFDFEVAVYGLQNAQGIPTDRLLHYRRPLQHERVKSGMPKDIVGRRLMIFEMAQGQPHLWAEFGHRQRMSTLTDAAMIHAALLNLKLPSKFVHDWLLWRPLKSVEWMPKELSLPISSTRDFWVAIFKAQVEAMIKNEGEIIGRPENKETVGPKALATKQRLLRLIPLIFPEGQHETLLYRPVLQHDDFGIHNLLNLVNERRDTRITSVFGWEAGCIVPLILSEVMFVNGGYKLSIDHCGNPATYDLSWWNFKLEDLDKNTQYTAEFLKEIKLQVRYLKGVAHKAQDVRRLWIELRNWNGKNAEGFFGGLGDWVERRLAERGIE